MKKKNKLKENTVPFICKENAFINISGYLTPFICPVCGGNGIVQNGFYDTVTGTGATSDATPEQCRSCNGTGVIWG